MTATQERPACGSCRHFFVTHRPERPWGCAAFGFASSQLPNVDIFAVTGTNCARYVRKPAVKPANTPKNKRQER